MSKSNKTARQELERLCGKGCFFRRANCEERIETIGTIRTFKKFLKEKKFSGKKISYQLTYHHLKHKSEGGETTIENGAVVSEIAHQYMHSLPREEEEIVNDMIREFKLNFGILSGEGKIIDSGSIDLDYGALEQEEDALIIPVYDTPIEEREWYKKTPEQKKKEKYERMKNPTRAMKKKELQRMIDEEDWER